MYSADRSFFANKKENVSVMVKIYPILKYPNVVAELPFGLERLTMQSRFSSLRKAFTSFDDAHTFHSIQAPLA